MSIPRPHRRFTVDEYERLIAIGLLREDEPIELIRGEIVEMSPIGARHIACVTRSSNWLTRNTGPEIAVSTQTPIQIPISSEPQPDIAVHSAAYDDTNPPTPADIFLVIEVSDSSLEYDRGTKLPLYAAAGIPEAWIFNLVANRIERHSDPGPDGHRSVAFAGSGKKLVVHRPPRPDLRCRRVARPAPTITRLIPPAAPPLC